MQFIFKHGVLGILCMLYAYFILWLSRGVRSGSSFMHFISIKMSESSENLFLKIRTTRITVLIQAHALLEYVVPKTTLLTTSHSPWLPLKQLRTKLGKVAYTAKNHTCRHHNIQYRGWPAPWNTTVSLFKVGACSMCNTILNLSTSS